MAGETTTRRASSRPPDSNSFCFWEKYDLFLMGDVLSLPQPVTHTFGSNTLWCETEPGKADFHPFVCNPDPQRSETVGQCVVFWGNACCESSPRERSAETPV